MENVCVYSYVLCPLIGDIYNRYVINRQRIARTLLCDLEYPSRIGIVQCSSSDDHCRSGQDQRNHLQDTRSLRRTFKQKTIIVIIEEKKTRIIFNVPHTREPNPHKKANKLKIFIKSVWLLQLYEKQREKKKHTNMHWVT